MDGRRKIRLVLEYEGTRYQGWQRQKNALTVQQTVEEALGRVLGEPVRLHGAGRTDAGVHARGQVAHFLTGSALPESRIQAGGNHYLPPDVVIREAAPAPPGFHARFSARGKHYRYRIDNSGLRPALGRRRAWAFFAPLDRDRLQAAAALFVGRHDFAAFSAVAPHTRPRSASRTVTRAAVEAAGDRIDVHLEAEGFLYHMARAIVGALVRAGRGRLEPEAISAALAGRRPGPLASTAPAHGLTLISVRY